MINARDERNNSRSFKCFCTIYLCNKDFIYSPTTFIWLSITLLHSITWSLYFFIKRSSALPDLLQFARDATSMSSGDDLLQFDLENIALHIDICMALLISNLIVLALSVAVLLYGLICDHHGNDENEVICSKSQCCITSHGRCRLIFLIVLLNATGLVLSISSMILFFNISTGNLKNDVKRILNDASEINEKGFEKLEIKHRCCGVLLYSGHVGANKNCPVAGELPNCTDTISAEFVSLVAGILLLASALIMQLSFFFVFCFCHRLSLNTQVPSNAANTNENHELNPLNPDHDNANEIVDENG